MDLALDVSVAEDYTSPTQIARLSQNVGLKLTSSVPLARRTISILCKQTPECEITAVPVALPTIS